MDSLSLSTVTVLALLHVAALFAAWSTRLTNGSRLESLSQLACFAGMIAVGAAGCFCCQIELGFSLPSGVTLVVMVLAAVADFRPTQEPVGRLQG
jgi:hypothetical protein